jgi:REP-associated tyrosine transposase
MVKFSLDISDNRHDIYFLTITLIDHKKTIETSDENHSILRCLINTMNHDGGKIEAYVLMPDHIHFLIKQGDVPFSKRVHAFKLQSNYAIYGRQKQLWQDRFWEHRIRDDEDYKNHIEHIHFNPVQHGYVSSPDDWEYSSFKQFAKEDLYEYDLSSSDDILVGSDH